MSILRTTDHFKSPFSGALWKYCIQTLSEWSLRWLPSILVPALPEKTFTGKREKNINSTIPHKSVFSSKKELKIVASYDYSCRPPGETQRLALRV